MKKILVLVGFLVALSAQANTLDSVFKKDSAIPVELQQRILDAINTRCGRLVMQYGLQEQSTNVRVERIDQGVIDYYFSTTFSSRYNFDGTHPVTTYITVESAQYSFSNGDNLEVSSVQSHDGCY